MNIEEMLAENTLLQEIARDKEVVWINPKQKAFAIAQTESDFDAQKSELGMKDIEEAEARLLRFAPLLMKCFPETEKVNGIIESELRAIPEMQMLLNIKYNANFSGRLLLKEDNELPIAGSVKARGGIYEVLKHTEELALRHGLITPEDDYGKLASLEAHEFFSQYTIQVGSTGNLGLSIGIMSAAIGYQAIVHMSSDAKEWKKDLLRQHGVTVIEHESDYTEAVKNGRRLSDEDPKSYFVDDENSRDLFLGYAVAAKRLERQLKESKIPVDRDHPLFVYLPCGVGGAPGGITFGLKQVFGDAVHCFFVEPTQAPCMTIGMASGLHQEISVQDLGLSGQTHADGLAVGRASGFVGKMMEPYLSGSFTIADPKLYEYMRDLLISEKIFLEPSACAAFQGPVKFTANREIQAYLMEHQLTNKMPQIIHIVWATGGSLVPEEIREEYKQTHLRKMVSME